MRRNTVTCSFPGTQQDTATLEQEDQGRWYRNKIAGCWMALRKDTCCIG